MNIEKALQSMNLSPEIIEESLANGKINLGYFNWWTKEMKRNYHLLSGFINRELPIEKKQVARCIEETTYFVSDDSVTAQVFYGSDSSD